MSTNHDAVAALPVSGSADKSLVRNVLTKRMPYVLADADDVTNLVAVDPATGAAIIDILFLGRVFHYDATDTTTANDGVSCLVSFEGRRYKLSSSSDVVAFAVLDNTHAAPPGSPSIGDAYLIAAAATGAWVGKSNYVTVFTRRGWEFINFGIGRLIYVEAIDSYYHKNAGGAWVVGFGAQTLGAGSVPILAVLGANASFVIKVENQTTNAPPGSPTAPTAYVIGPSPTGAWAGNAGKIAMCLVSGSFQIISPVAGDEVYDKAKQVAYTFNGTSWIASSTGMLNSKVAGVTPSTAFTTGGSGFYSPFSFTTPPTSAQLYAEDSRTLTYAAKGAGNILVFHYDALVVSGDTGAVALFQDSVSNAIAWNYFTPTPIGSVHGPWQFGFTVGDAASHTYKIRFIVTSGSGFSGFGSFLFRVEEYGG